MAPISFENFAAALFDLDGTLVETMGLHHAAYAEVLAEFGLTLSYAQYMAAVGPPAREAIPLFVRAAGGDESRLPSSPELHARKKRAFSRLLAAGALEPLRAFGLVQAARAQVPVALVSSGNREGVSAIVEAMGWTSLFDVIVSGDDVVYGKPHPEPYLRGAALLNVDPKGCIAFEDTDAGLQSARAAGMEAVDVRVLGAAP